MKIWLIYSGILFYMEAVFHLRFFGLQMGNPLFPIGVILLVAAIQTLISEYFKEENEKKRMFRLMMGVQYVLFGAQTVYYLLFKQPLQITAAVMGGQDALTNYWQVALDGILRSVPMLFLLAVPLIVLEALRKKGKWKPQSLAFEEKLHVALVAGSLLFYCFACMLAGGMAGEEYAEEYREYYDPETVICNMGVITMMQRDSAYEIEKLMSEMSDGYGVALTAETVQKNVIVSTSDGSVQTAENTEESGNDLTVSAGDVSENEQEQEEEMPDTSPNAWEIDLAALSELSKDGKETKWLSEYIAELTPTNKNEYTGMFEGYNLIFLTAEGFSTYAIREDLTPTLYKMVNSSFVFSNYYVPLWSTSTSDGEYINCTGLMPAGQFSLRRSAENNMLYTLPRFFAAEDVYSRAYHNNTLDYYDRHKSHPNLGYDFKASLLGGLSEAEWGKQIFPMENPKAWPASDYEMIQGSLPEYIGDDRFHVYYMTVSGHVNYNFLGNSMSAKNKDAVAELEGMSENARAYIACQIELDKALAYLLEQLEEAGKLNNTVICLSADHYPYGMSEEQYEELAGKDLSAGLDLYRNSLILWNGAMAEAVPIEKVCGPMDLLPTLLNLFGFDFDSRIYAGRDIFSDGEGLVVFKDKSFVSDFVSYNRKTKEATWLAEQPQEGQDAYMERIKKEADNRGTFSTYILQNDYYSLIESCRETR